MLATAVSMNFDYLSLHVSGAGDEPEEDDDIIVRWKCIDVDSCSENRLLGMYMTIPEAVDGEMVSVNSNLEGSTIYLVKENYMGT